MSSMPGTSAHVLNDHSNQSHKGAESRQFSLEWGCCKRASNASSMSRIRCVLHTARVEVNAFYG